MGERLNFFMNKQVGTWKVVGVFYSEDTYQLAMSTKHVTKEFSLSAVLAFIKDYDHKLFNDYVSEFPEDFI